MGRESACDLFYRLPCVLAMESERHSVSLRDLRLGVRSYTHALFARKVQRKVSNGGPDLTAVAPSLDGERGLGQRKCFSRI
jgi:hypothetical protein